MSAPSYDDLIRAVAGLLEREVDGTGNTCGCCAYEECIFCSAYVGKGRPHTKDCVYAAAVRHLPHYEQLLKSIKETNEEEAPAP